MPSRPFSIELCCCVSFSQDDEKFLTEFFSLLSDEKTPITKRRDLVQFLKEFCSFSQTLQPQHKETFFKVRPVSVWRSCLLERPDG